MCIIDIEVTQIWCLNGRQIWCLSIIFFHSNNIQAFSFLLNHSFSLFVRIWFHHESEKFGGGNYIFFTFFYSEWWIPNQTALATGYSCHEFREANANENIHMVRFCKTGSFKSWYSSGAPWRHGSIRATTLQSQQRFIEMLQVSHSCINHLRLVLEYTPFDQFLTRFVHVAVVSSLLVLWKHWYIATLTFTRQKALECAFELMVCRWKFKIL